MELLNNLAEIQAGYQSSEKIAVFKNGTHQLIQAKDIKDGAAVDYSGMIGFYPLRKAGLYQVNNGDVLFQARGFHHYAININQCPANVLASSTFYIIRIKSNRLKPGYLAWWLNQAPVQNYLKEKAGKSYLSFVSVKILANVMIELPSEEIQDNIEKLTSLTKKEKKLMNELINNREKLINQCCLNKIRKQEQNNEFNSNAKDHQ